MNSKMVYTCLVGVAGILAKSDEIIFYGALGCRDT